ncbi:MAG: sodium:proton antiporter [Sphingobacteriaceae bacterium]|nr:MAG: sodium:proton antiporter [Sphingobacteriaceae bacterium]
MDQYLVMVLLVGIAGFGMSFMPAVTKRTGISYSTIYVAAGVLIYLILPDYLPKISPLEDGKMTIHLSELIVIISLMGTGLKIDRVFSFSKWSTPLKLVGIAMLLCMGVCCLLGYFMLGLALPSAVLIAAVLAPTDPVLAADVQVGPPQEKVKSETRFSLTSEAGINDGMAFPFVWLAITLSLTTSDLPTQLFHWFGFHLLYKIAGGLILGWLSGKFTGYLVFTISEKYRLISPTDGFLAISLTLCTYGLTEALHGYGFIAVFVAGFTLRHSEKSHRYHQELHSFTDQIERLLLGILLIFFGGTLVSGILEPLNLKMVLFSLLLLFLVRPIIACLSLTGSKMHWKEQLAISFFGIRGMGSVFYLAFALEHAHFNNAKDLWAIVAFTMLLSIVMHGLTATTVMKHLQIEVDGEPIPK